MRREISSLTGWLSMVRPKSASPRAVRAEPLVDDKSRAEQDCAGKLYVPESVGSGDAGYVGERRKRDELADQLRHGQG